MPDERVQTDWRDAGAYALLLEADRSIFAGEWLRRDPSYQAAAEQASVQSPGGQPSGVEPQLYPEHWGLHAFVPAELAAPLARPIWRARDHAYVLAVRAEKVGSPADRIDMNGLPSLATSMAAADGQEHLLISDGLRSIRLEVIEGSVLKGPVKLRYEIAGFISAEPALLVLRRLLAFRVAGRFSKGLHPAEARAQRWVLVLRIHDALATGANQREIAAQLISSTAPERRWRSEAPSIRSQVQRLVRGARAMMNGGYRALLR